MSRPKSAARKKKTPKKGTAAVDGEQGSASGVVGNDRRDAKKLRRKLKKGASHPLATAMDVEQTSVSEMKPEASVQGSAGSLPEQSFDFSRLRAFRYCISEKFHAERNFFMKRDPSNVECMTVTNVPSFIPTDSLKTLFAKYLTDGGTIKEVVVQRSTAPSGNLSEGYQTISVHFDSEYAVELALKRCQSVGPVCLSDEDIEPLSCGPSKFAKEYRQNYVPIEDLQRQVDEFFSTHDAKVLEEKRNARKMRNVPDEEGWITVTKTKHKPLPPAVVVKNKRDLEKVSKKNKEPGRNLAFYSFQLKQSKVKRLEELRARFEEDKKKIALAKAGRKFKPS